LLTSIVDVLIPLLLSIGRRETVNIDAAHIASSPEGNFGARDGTKEAAAAAPAAAAAAAGAQGALVPRAGKAVK